MTLDPAAVALWIADHDPMPVGSYTDVYLERIGHHPTSEYAERFWLPLLGPSALWALRRLAVGLDHSPDGFTIPLRALGGELGLRRSLRAGHRAGLDAPLVRCLARLVRFDFAAVRADRFDVRVAVPPISARHLDSLPPHLAAQARAEVAS